MNRKIIEDISMDNHTYFSSYIFHSTYMPKYPMISRIENKSKSRVRERNNWHRILTWKTSKEIKDHRPTTDQKHPLWRIKTEYKVLPNSSQPILPGPLNQYLHFQLLTFFFQSTLGVCIKLDLDLFLNSHKKKMGFCTKPREWEMDVSKINPYSFSENPLKKKSSFKTWMGFSWSKQAQREKGMRSTRMAAAVSLLQKWEKVHFKWKWNP